MTRSVGSSVNLSAGWLSRIAAAILLALVCAGGALRAQSTLTVAAAANLGPVLREISANFEKRTGTHVALVFGSSGSLTTQIANGAPYDVFMSADLDYPHRLESQGLAVLGSMMTYASGKLVLWAPKTLPVDLQALGMRALTAPQVRRIAIANPDHAPYGKAAVAALRRATLYDAVKARLVLGEDVAQASQFVLSGNAQVGILPLSLALAPEMRNGQHWELPPDAYPSMEQGAVVLRKSKNETLAHDFLNYLKSEEAAALFRRYGYGVPRP